jgi:hypothetical protein
MSSGLDPASAPSGPWRTGTGATFSVVVPLGASAPHPGDLLAALERQTLGPSRLDVVLVVAGADDETATTVQAWAEGRPTARVVALPDAGRGAALEHGLRAAEGAWVLLADPDVVPADDFLERMAAAVEAPSTAGAAVHAGRERPAGEEPSDGPGEPRLVDLSREPAALPPSLSAVVLHRERLLAQEPPLDERVGAAFADAHLLARHLLAAPAPTVALVPDAVTVRRAPAERHDPDALTGLVEHGYLDLLDRATSGAAPAVWVQRLVADGLAAVVRSSQRITSPYGGLGPDVGRRFVELAAAVCARLQPDVLAGSRERPPAPWVSGALLSHLGTRDWVGDRVRTGRVRGDVVELRLLFSGRVPRVRLVGDHGEAAPVSATVRDYEMLGQVLVREHVLWADAGAPLRVEVDGEPADVRIRGRRTPDGLRARDVRAADPALGPDEASGLRALGRRAWRRARGQDDARPPHGMRDAWVFMDRVDAGGDNGEAFCRWVRERHPEVDAWFVLDPASPDWPRLEREGFRLVAHGSDEHAALTRHARFLLSSHARSEHVQPFGPDAPAPRWRFVFLQHGVATGDMSRWLNQRDIALVLATAGPEHDAFAGESTYRLTPSEVVHVPMPRLHELSAAAREAGAPHRLLVAPTWRRELAARFSDAPLAERQQAPYVRHWTGVLGSDDLHRVAEQHGLRVTFVPHPNARELFTGLVTDERVDVVSPDETPYRALLATSAVLVTDYSSITFDLAWLGRPTVYLQHDRDEFYGGRHNVRTGWFSYEDDGFGPVTHDVAGTVQGVEEVLSGSGVYRARVARLLTPRERDEANAELFDRVLRIP